MLNYFLSVFLLHLMTADSMYTYETYVMFQYMYAMYNDHTRQLAYP